MLKRPEEIRFKRLTIADRESVLNVVGRFDAYSDFNFTSLFAWGVNSSTSVALIDDNLLIRLRDYEDKSKFRYSIIGDNNIVDVINKLSRATDLDYLEIVPEFVAQKLAARGFEIEHDRNNDDYVYSLSDLAALEGPEYRKHRRAISNMKSKNATVPILRKISHTNLEQKSEILELTKKWRTVRGLIYNETANEYFAVRKALKYSNDLDIDLWGCYMHEKLVGFVVTEKIGNVAVLHFEKADTNIRGLGTYLKQIVFQKLLEQGCSVLNYEQDLGVAGLRELKTSLSPSHYLKKYTVKINRA